MAQVLTHIDRLEFDPGLSNRTALVVDPRINQADIDYTRIPSDIDVYRFGAFTAELALHFGRDVAGWFVDDSASVEDFTRVKLRGEYRLGRILVDGSRTRLGIDALRRAAHRNVFDYAHLIASNPELAVWFMRDRRPNPISRMVAVVAAMGYGTVLVLDQELSSITSRRSYITARPATNVGDSTLALDRRYESWSRINNDLGVLAAALTQFPDTAFHDVTVGNRMRLVLTPAPEVPSANRLVPLAKYPLGDDHLSALLPVGPGGEELRCAYVTMCDSHEYLWGVRALANSLAAVSDVPLVLMVPPGFDITDVSFEHGNVRLHPVNSIRNPHDQKSHQLRFTNTYTKLEVFGLGFLDRAVFIDADTIVLRSPDELFGYEGFAAAPDFGLRLENDVFNSGVFVCSPDADLYQRLLALIPSTPSYDGGDQGFLNEVLTDITWLPPEYNTLRRALGRYPDVVTLQHARIIHYVGPKPWHLVGEPEWSSLDDLWFAQLSDHEKIEYIIELRDAVGGRVARGKGRDPFGTGKGGYREAERLLALGKHNSAIKVARAALKQTPDSLRNRQVLAKALLASGNRQGAAKVMAKTTAMRAARFVRRRIPK
ncbi:glycosyltransferase family 8 protein [Brevibacterium samyangense]|uniref:Glycosyl transferase n=1 Tax=Brevibacterium samyangense TaxID=366888 RepID=A0ABN2T7A4_9MICO